MMSEPTVLELQNVDVCYGSIQVLWNIQIRIQKDELICLLGGNASGKSTILKTILGICRPKNGAVLLNGLRIEDRKSVV